MAGASAKVVSASVPMRLRADAAFRCSIDLERAGSAILDAFGVHLVELILSDAFGEFVAVGQTVLPRGFFEQRVVVAAASLDGGKEGDCCQDPAAGGTDHWQMCSWAR